MIYRFIDNSDDSSSEGELSLLTYSSEEEEEEEEEEGEDPIGVDFLRSDQYWSLDKDSDEDGKEEDDKEDGRVGMPETIVAVVRVLRRLSRVRRKPVRFSDQYFMYY